MGGIVDCEYISVMVFFKAMDRGEKRPRVEHGNAICITRDFRPEDLETVVMLMAEAELSDENWDAPEKIIRRAIERPESMIVAERDGKAVGSIFVVDDFYPQMYRLVVKESYRGQGIGAELLRETEYRMAWNGHTQIWGLADADEQELLGWYEHIGYTTTGPWNGIYKEIDPEILAEVERDKTELEEYPEDERQREKEEVVLRALRFGVAVYHDGLKIMAVYPDGKRLFIREAKTLDSRWHEANEAFPDFSE